MSADHDEPEPLDEGEQQFRTGRVALVGRPNVGKSTLLNRLIGQELAAVSGKPQTTRMIVRGIVSGPWYQLVLEDTPGLMDPRSALDKAILRAARVAAASADVVVALVLPWERGSDADVDLIGRIPGKAGVIAAVNKIDRVPKPILLPLMARLSGLPRVTDVVPICALDGDGVDRLVTTVARRVPAGAPLYPVDQLSDQPERFFVAEMLREGIMTFYHEEVPYAAAVEIEEYAERENGTVYIKAFIWVERESQRAILVGRDGGALKRLGTRSRAAVERLLGKPVYLELWVKVRPQWRERQEDLRRFGFAPS